MSINTLLQPIQVKILDERITQNNFMPQYATPHSAGIDLRALIEKPTILNPNETILIRTGLAIYIENPNYVGIIVPRSGLGHKHGIVTGNLVGVIDADYQGEIMVSLWNRSLTAYVIQEYERIAQLLIMPIVQAQFNIVDTFNQNSLRGKGGFGSTGSM
jgi:dUTP pyrophosphatase